MEIWPIIDGLVAFLFGPQFIDGQPVSQGWVVAAIQLAAAAYGAKRAKDQQDKAKEGADAAGAEEAAWRSKQREQYERDLELRNRQFQREQQLQNYTIAQQAYRNTVAAQERNYDISFINRMLDIKDQEQMREIMRQNKLDFNAAQDFARRMEWHTKNSNLAASERQEMRQDLDRFNHILAQERGYEERAYESAVDQLKDERLTDFENYRIAQAQTMEERNLAERRRMALEGEIQQMGLSLESVIRNMGDPSPRRQYNQLDIEDAAERRFAWVEDAFDEQSEYEHSKLSAAQKAQGFGGITATGIGDAASEAHKARLMARLASDKTALRAQAYDQGVAEINNLQGLENMRHDYALNDRKRAIDEVLSRYTPGLEYSMRLPDSPSGVYDRQIASAAFYQPLSTSAASDLFTRLPSAIYDRPTPALNDMITNLDIPTRTTSMMPKSAITNFIGHGPGTTFPDTSSLGNSLSQYYSGRSNAYADAEANARANYGQAQSDLFNAASGFAGSFSGGGGGTTTNYSGGIRNPRTGQWYNTRPK